MNHLYLFLIFILLNFNGLAHTGLDKNEKVVFDQASVVKKAGELVLLQNRESFLAIPVLGTVTMTAG